MILSSFKSRIKWNLVNVSSHGFQRKSNTVLNNPHGRFFSTLQEGIMADETTEKAFSDSKTSLASDKELKKIIVGMSERDTWEDNFASQEVEKEIKKKALLSYRFSIEKPNKPADFDYSTLLTKEENDRENRTYFFRGFPKGTSEKQVREFLKSLDVDIVSIEMVTDVSAEARAANNLLKDLMKNQKKSDEKWTPLPIVGEGEQIDEALERNAGALRLLLNQHANLAIDLAKWMEENESKMDFVPWSGPSNKSEEEKFPVEKLTNKQLISLLYSTQKRAAFRFSYLEQVMNERKSETAPVEGKSRQEKRQQREEEARAQFVRRVVTMVKREVRMLNGLVREASKRKYSPSIPLVNEDAKVEREEKDDFEFAEFSTAREENSEKPVEPYKRASEADVTERRVTEAFVRNVKSKDVSRHAEVDNKVNAFVEFRSEKERKIFSSSIVSCFGLVYLSSDAKKIAQSSAMAQSFRIKVSEASQFRQIILGVIDPGLLLQSRKLEMEQKFTEFVTPVLSDGLSYAFKAYKNVSREIDLTLGFPTFTHARRALGVLQWRGEEKERMPNAFYAFGWSLKEGKQVTS